MLGILKGSLLLLGVHSAYAVRHVSRSEKNGTRDWDAAAVMASDFVSKLTLDEKVSMITGNSSAGNCIGVITPIPRLGFQGLCLLDGPAAINRVDLVSVFPSGITAAATFDRDLIYRRGYALCEEFKGKGGHTFDGSYGSSRPGWANWEGFGPDPYLAGISIAQTVHGVQDAGVQTCSKHYIANEQETQRSNTNQTDGTRAEAISANAGTTSVMCSYNRLNQTYSCEISHTLTKLLREELGFQGYTVSDWFATHSTSESINAGLDMEMPGIIPSYQGSVLYFDAEDYPTADPTLRWVTLIQEVGLGAAKAGGFLPDDFAFEHGRDSSPKIIGVFGNDAGDMTDGFYRPFEVPDSVNTGTMIIGGGSGTSRASYIVSPLRAIQAKAAETGAEVLYATNNKLLARNDFRGIYPPPEICVVFQQTFASESFDRTSFELDGNSTAVIDNVADFCGNTIVVTHSGGVNTMPWANHTKIGEILLAHYPEKESGNSIVDLLWGDIAPSGRLPYTVPRDEADAGPPIVNITGPVSDPLAWQADFTEGQLIDYRHYDAQNIEPLYEFSFGLTYTTFAIEDNKIDVSLVKGNSSVTAHPDASLKTQPGGNPQLWDELVTVKAKVTNTGDRSAHAVPQLYLSYPTGAPEGTPRKVLRGFEKVMIDSGASADVEFGVLRRDLSLWDVVEQDWVIPGGQFTFRVGFSSRDLPAKTMFSVLG
ncbi:putative beta-glucosidase G [Colletotrichum aenigma]|uniref:putative beta-glucosidase G n=1 Tax=Colletotrichum aenigma TaxID=1215731 RepID=UPI001872765B|nr:putative beta-glucosidase G [Colletotrichum aenigma]KAF5502327.1 putative beta-glucosidase G [Colletotrichum aenigma]